MTMDRQSSDIPSVEASLSEPHIFEIIRGVLLNEGLRTEAKSYGLDPVQFRGSWYTKYGLIWRAILNLTEAKVPVDYSSLFGTLVSLFNNQPGILGPEDQQLVFNNSEYGLVYRLFYTQQVLNPDYWRTVIRRFLEEREFAKLKAFVESVGEGQAPVAMSEFVEKLGKSSQRLQAVSASPEVDWFGVAQSAPLRKTRPSGTFIDDFLGGHADGESIGIYAPFGSGKSLLGQQVAADSAKADRTAHQLYPSKPLRHWYLLSYELDQAKATLRLLSCITKIHSDSIRAWSEAGCDPMVLSTSADPENAKPYEKILYAEGIRTGTFVGERERMLWAQEAKATNLHLWDMSGKEKTRGSMGSGYLHEVMAHLHREEEEYGHNIGGVVIDYADKMVDDYLTAQNKDREKYLRHFVGAPLSDALSRLTGQFKCPAYMLYQFDTKLNQKPTWYLGTHADGAGGKDSARNLDYALVMSKKDETTKLSRFGVSKDRYGCSIVEENVPRVLINRGEFGRLEPAVGYTFDANQNRFVSPGDAAGWRNGAIRDPNAPAVSLQSAAMNRFMGNNGGAAWRN